MLSIILLKTVCVSNNRLSTDLFFESSYDLANRPLDLHTYGAISPKLQEEDCMSSSKLEELAGEAYKKLGIL